VVPSFLTLVKFRKLRIDWICFTMLTELANLTKQRVLCRDGPLRAEAVTIIVVGFHFPVQRS